MSVERFVEILETKKVRFRTLFHFTDSRNIPSIRSHGLLSLRELKRKGIPVAAPGGNTWSHDADESCGLDAFVHLCFHNQHPMAHIAKIDGRIDDIIYLHIDARILLQPGVLVTTDVSNKSGVEPKPIADALGALDLEVIYKQTDWKDPDVKKRLFASRKYEVLVPDAIPHSAIRNL